MADAKIRREKALEEQKKKDEESLREEQELKDEISWNSTMLKGSFVMLVIFVILPELKPIVFENASGKEMTMTASSKIVPIVCVSLLIFGIWSHRKELIEKAEVLADKNARITNRPA